jgi:lipopolysaccharide export system ATP-binding protein
MPLLQTSNLRKVYAGRTVVNDVSFHVERSEIVGLLGRNGAGKTTSFRMTIGMIDSDGGRWPSMERMSQVWPCTSGRGGAWAT